MSRFSILIILFFCIKSNVAFSERVGPAQNPHSYEDFGGTKDLVLSDGLHISPEELNELLELLGSNNLAQRVDATLKINHNANNGETVFKEALWSRPAVSMNQMQNAIRAASRGADDSSLPKLLESFLRLDPGRNVTPSVEIFVMLYALAQVDTLAGYKILLEFSPSYSGLFGNIIARMFVTAGLKSFPALVYGRGSPDKEVQSFAVRCIKDMGEPSLGEQLAGISNARRLAQLFEAYASINDLNAISVTLSSTNHNSSFVRAAARSSLARYGQNARWLIRREYENAFAEDPPDGTDFRDWIKILYQLWDEQRNAEVMGDFFKAEQLVKQGHYEKMDLIYREILSVLPAFNRRNAMGSNYLLWANSLSEQKNKEQYNYALLMAARLMDNDNPMLQVAKKKLDFQQMERLRNLGFFDESYYVQAQDDEVLSQKAQKVLAETRQAVQKNTGIKVFLVTILIFIGSLLVFFRIKQNRPFFKANRRQN